MRPLFFLLISISLVFPPLIGYSADLNEGLYTAVLRGSRDGLHDNKGLAESYISQGANVNAYHTGEMTPLIKAVEFGDIQMIKLLLDHGADPNLPWKREGEDTIVPLGLAANFINLSDDQVVQTIELLLAHGAKVNAQSPKSHYTPLMYIALRNRLQAVEALLDAGADINACDSQGKTVLMLAASNGLTDIVRLLLKHRANASLTDNLNETVLDIALYQKRRAVIDVLMAQRKGIGVRTLDAAMYENDVPLMAQILEAGDNVNKQDPNGQSILMKAAYDGNVSMVKMLIDHHAQLDLLSKDLGTAFTRAVEGQHTQVAKLLLEAGANVSDHSTGNWVALFSAAETGQTEIMRLMLDKGVDVDVRGAADMTALMLACDKGQLAAVKILLEHKANMEAVNSKRIAIDVGDNFVGTPVQWAEHGGHPDIAQFLISKGAHPHPPLGHAQNLFEGI